MADAVRCPGSSTVEHLPCNQAIGVRLSSRAQRLGRSEGTLAELSRFVATLGHGYQPRRRTSSTVNGSIAAGEGPLRRVRHCTGHPSASPSAQNGSPPCGPVIAGRSRKGTSSRFPAVFGAGSPLGRAGVCCLNSGAPNSRQMRGRSPVRVVFSRPSGTDAGIRGDRAGIQRYRGPPRTARSS